MHRDDPHQRGRQTSFHELVDRHSRFLYRVAYALLGNRQDAEDAVQDMFMKLFRTKAWQQNIANERAYLAQAVWRAGLDRRSTAEAKCMRFAEDVEEISLRSAEATPEERAIAESDRALLQRLMAELPEELRQPLLLSAIEEIRGAEIAATLGIPEATVRTRLHRARTELRLRFLALAATRQEARR